MLNKLLALFGYRIVKLHNTNNPNMPRKTVDRLSQIMLANHDRVIISKRGVIRVDLNNEKVQSEINKHVESLSKLDELN